MKNQIKICMVIFFLLLSVNLFSYVFLMPKFTSNVYSQQIDDKYQIRRDDYDLRREGIKPQKSRPVTSDRIVLLSALIRTEIFDITQLPKDINLGFYCDKKTSPSVSVFYEPKLYYVDFLRKYWGPGFMKFCWPTEIMLRNEIQPHQLFARSVFIKQGIRTIFPVCLYYRNLPNVVREYRFIVTPLMKMNLRYWIIDVNTEKPVITGPVESVGKHKKRLITWNCRDFNNKIIPEGEYILKLQGTYKDRFGRKRICSVDYRFCHKNNLSK